MATDASHYFDPHYFGWQAASAERSPRVVAPRILERVTASSVVDVGCGTGPWLEVSLALGVDEVLRIDGPYVDPVAASDSARLVPRARLGGTARPRASIRSRHLALRPGGPRLARVARREPTNRGRPIQPPSFSEQA